MKTLPSALLVAALVVAGAASADGIGDRGKDALDPDCTLEKGARGAARKATIGVRGNRCDAAETTRDALGIDDHERDDRDGERAVDKIHKKQ